MDRRDVFHLCSCVCFIPENLSWKVLALLRVHDKLESYWHRDNNDFWCYLSNTFSLRENGVAKKNDKKNEDLLVAVESNIGTVMDRLHLFLDGFYKTKKKN